MTSQHSHSTPDPDLAATRRAALKRVKRSRRSRKIKALLTAAAVAALVCAAGIAAQIAFEPQEREAGAVVSSYENMSIDEIQADLDRRAAESMMTVSVNPSPLLERDGTLHVNVVNDNGERWAQRFTVFQESQAVYESGIIEPGQCVPDCLAPNAAPGEATVEVQGLDPLTLEPRGNPASVLVSIVEAT